MFSSNLVLVSCSTKKTQSLDEEYYWVSSERKKVFFTIRIEKGTIRYEETDNFTIDKQNNTFYPLRQDFSNLKVNFISKIILLL